MKKITILISVLALLAVAPIAAQAESDIGWKSLALCAEIDDCKKAAKKGDATAMYLLGLMYYTGKEVPVDHFEAFKLLKESSEKGHADAQYMLGTFYAGGVGTDKDIVNAEYWLKRSADQGHKGARIQLDTLSGRGFTNNMSLGQLSNPMLPNKILARAKKGDPHAQLTMGVLLMQGKGVEKNLVKSYAWFNLAAEHQDESNKRANQGLKHMTGQVESALSPSELKEAQKLVKTLKKEVKRNKKEQD